MLMHPIDRKKLWPPEGGNMKLLKKQKIKINNKSKNI
jgi:hypothetical protein